MMYSMDDVFYMKRALRLAKRAEGHTSPNPLVGAVIVRNNRIITEGYHKRAGMPHAEAEAINSATAPLEGSTMYVTLEPCCHTDKRTPPCTSAIITSKIKRVVVSMLDPNPKVSGKGIKTLQNAGIKTDVGILEKEARKLNEFYIHYIINRVPFVILKTAMTLDGKIATPDGESKWITCDASRRIVHQYRGRVDAILSAIGTVKADNPRFTARLKGKKDPVRVIIDPDLKVPDGYHVLSVPPRTIIITQKSGKRVNILRDQGIEFIQYTGSLDMRQLMKELGNQGITSVLIEGGSSLAWHALEDEIVDKLLYFIAPKIIGGRDSYTAVGGRSFRTIQNAFQVNSLTARRSGDDILVEGYLKKR